MSLVLLTLIIASASADYWETRDSFIKIDQSYNVGGKLVLSEKEEKVSDVISKLKVHEYDHCFDKPGNFSPAVHFFHSKAAIERSEVFKFIQKMPKGASLHGHDSALVSDTFLFNLTYWPKLYGCTIKDKLILTFLPGNRDCKLLEVSRTENPSFDFVLRSKLTLIVNNPKATYPNINIVWAKFNDIFNLISEMLTYKPVFEAYFLQVLQELYDDKVMYMEFRGTLPPIYEDNKTYTSTETLGFYKTVVESFKSTHHKFFGAKFIYAPIRNVNNGTMREYIETFKTLNASYPHFLAGFDLVGQEDKGEPLSDFIPELLEIKNGTKFFFHAGETNWYGSSTDYNLFDAVLLGSSRIGHGYAIIKHMALLEEIMRIKIAIEISPISNQVLSLVDDLRNHPGNTLIAAGLPVVICNDDPSLWGAKGLSYDWYVAFMGMTSRNTSLKFLKQIALNSIIYSALTPEEQITAMKQWQEDWDAFLEAILIEHSGNLINSV